MYSLIAAFTSLFPNTTPQGSSNGSPNIPHPRLVAQVLFLSAKKKEKEEKKTVVQEGPMDSEPLWFKLIGEGNVDRFKQELQGNTFDVNSKVFATFLFVFPSAHMCVIYV